MPFSKKKIVCIEWEDASSYTGYYDSRRPDDTTTVNTHTVGYLIENNRKVLKLGVECFEDGAVRHIHSIPKGMVRKITYLREVHDAIKRR